MANPWDYVQSYRLDRLDKSGIQAWQGRVQALQDQLYILKKEMFGHADCCPRIRGYLLLTAEKVAQPDSLSVTRGRNGT